MRTHPHGLAKAKACAVPGRCLFCEEPLPPHKTKPRIICSSQECRLAYLRSYWADRRAAGAAQ